MSEDEDIARAIALSLQDQVRPVTKTRAEREVIVIDSDDEADLPTHDGDLRFEKDLKRALEASKADTSSRTSTPINGASTRSSSIQPANPQSNFLSERVQMERERRERQMKRQRETGLDVPSQPPTTLDSDSGEDDDGGEEPPRKRQHLSSSSARAHTNSSASSSNQKPLIDQIFWDGELRPTANRFAVNDSRPKFTLNESLGRKDELAFAIISSYVASVSWIYTFFDPSVPVIFVSQPDASGSSSIKNILPNWIKAAPFLRSGYGFHAGTFYHIITFSSSLTPLPKLFYKTGRLRVIISTANLIDYDYRDIENTLWLQDVPKRPNPSTRDPKADTHGFSAMMIRVLKAVNVQPALTTFLQNDHPGLPLQTLDDLGTHWDWSKVKVHLVPSIAGKHEGWPSVVHTGHPRLMMAIRKMGLSLTGKSNMDLSLECQGSSIGNYTPQWMNEFFISAKGESAEGWLGQTKRKRETTPFPPIKVIFPSLRTVKASAMGENGGGTMFCSTRTWEAKNFPRQLFHDSNSKAGGVLMHTKMIIGLVKPKSQPSIVNSLNSTSSKAGSSKPKQVSRRKENEFGSETEDSDDEVQIVDSPETDEKPIGWAYVGSHNFTPSAWGTLSGTSFTPILNITNYELGIVFPLMNEADVERVSCWKRPPRKYVLNEDRPWIQEESAYFQQQQQ
ncbi:hypothetical protein ONZ45_g13197 [Pleurotus djamor]|nr:hypothetical protein ONZ45_g13197 [Pleurotus djamor]